MRKRVKAIIAISAAVLFVLGVVFFNSDIWQFIRYRYDDKYLPPDIEAALLFNAGVDEGELLSEEELREFSDGFEEEFSGYYDSMPENLRRLTESFIERINTRYKINYSVSQVNVSVKNSPYPEWITFRFSLNGFNWIYDYRTGSFAEKYVYCTIPREAHSIIPDQDGGGLPLHIFFTLMSDMATVYYRPDNVSVEISKQTSKKGRLTVGEIPTADFDEYMSDAKQDGVLDESMLNEKLSIKRIEKHITSKQKSEAKAMSR